MDPTAAGATDADTDAEADKSAQGTRYAIYSDIKNKLFRVDAVLNSDHSAPAPSSAQGHALTESGPVTPTSASAHTGSAADSTKPKVEHASFVFCHPPPSQDASEFAAADRLLVFSHDSRSPHPDSTSTCRYSFSVRKAVRELPVPFAELLVVNYTLHPNSSALSTVPSAIAADTHIMMRLPERMMMIGEEKQSDGSVWYHWQTTPDSGFPLAAGASLASSSIYWDSMADCHQKQRIPAFGYKPPPELRHRSSYASVDFSHRSCDALSVWVDKASGLIVKTHRLHVSAVNSYAKDTNEALLWDLLTASPLPAVFHDSVPKDWRLSCLDGDMRLVLDPVRAYLVEKGHSDAFNLSLAVQPIAALGAIWCCLYRMSYGLCTHQPGHAVVMRVGSVLISFGASSTFKVEPSHLVFTPLNWHEAQKVYLYYVADGEDSVCIHATGIVPSVFHHFK